MLVYCNVAGSKAAVGYSQERVDLGRWFNRLVRVPLADSIARRNTRPKFINWSLKSQSLSRSLV
jgi:hypothetical protein